MTDKAISALRKTRTLLEQICEALGLDPEETAIKISGVDSGVEYLNVSVADALKEADEVIAAASEHDACPQSAAEMAPEKGPDS